MRDETITMILPCKDIQYEKDHPYDDGFGIMVRGTSVPDGKLDDDAKNIGKINIDLDPSEALALAELLIDYLVKEGKMVSVKII